MMVFEEGVKVEKVYKQIPAIREDKSCPICGMPIAHTKVGKIMLYKSPNKTKIINHQMFYCKNCDIMFGDSHLRKSIKREQQGYWVSMFLPKKNAKREYIEHLIERYYQPKFEQVQQQISPNKKALNKIEIENVLFDTYHVLKCNVKRLARTVCTTPVGFTNCPICGKILVRDYVYAVQISDTECIKSNGCMCSRCNMFFTVSQKLFYNLEKLRVNKDAYELKSDYCVSYDYKKYSSIFNERESVYKQITVCSTNDIRTYTIVYDIWEAEEEENIIYYSSETAVKLLLAEKDNTPIIIDDKEFHIVKTRNKNIDSVQKREIDNVVLHKKYFNNELPELSSQNTLYIYNGKIFCHHRHSVTEVKAYIDDFDGGASSFFAEYCYDCDKFIMKYEDYKQYLKEYHFFPMKLSMLNMNYDDYNRAKNSPLSLNGYTTNEKDGLSSKERQKILSGIIKSGVLSKRKVLDYIEMFIRESINNPRRQPSIPKWEEDKEFVLNYSLDKAPEVHIWKIQRRKYCK